MAPGPLPFQLQPQLRQCSHMFQPQCLHLFILLVTVRLHL